MFSKEETYIERKRVRDVFLCNLAILRVFNRLIKHQHHHHDITMYACGCVFLIPFLCVHIFLCPQMWLVVSTRYRIDKLQVKGRLNRIVTVYIPNTTTTIICRFCVLAVVTEVVLLTFDRLANGMNVISGFVIYINIYA